ncbi:hypothetical protein NPIL_196281 [Nephila pilipes]|uniref:Uncharacterized protein n=1 Tax=Nephila pilipes TaxID=299642 RepID=A0A8X6UBS7_NEPPI|nr:hypothetical protein NPIL_196281 [Nephila pilipes]
MKDHKTTRQRSDPGVKKSDEQIFFKAEVMKGHHARKTNNANYIDILLSLLLYTVTKITLKYLTRTPQQCLKILIKTFERMLTSRLRFTLESAKIIEEERVGFRNGTVEMVLEI